MRVKPDFWVGNERICWLCVLMEGFAGTNSLENAPALMSGLASVFRAPILQAASQAIFNMRQMSFSFVTTHSIKHAVALYNEHHHQAGTTGTYRIDAETLTFQRTDPFEDPLITRAREYLSRSLEHETHTRTFADPLAPMAVRVIDGVGTHIPIGPITPPLHPRRTHNVSRRPNGTIRIPMAELAGLAREMDERDALSPERRPGNWELRLKGLSVLKPDASRSLSETKVIELQDTKHLIGLPGSGKTTILMLMAVWLGRRGYKCMLVFPAIEVARQYMADLTFHEVQVGMLVGQNQITRREHANRISEVIAAEEGQGGFGHTISGADAFAANCMLPAFATAETDAWRFGYAPCTEVFQAPHRNGRMKKQLCPVWTMCGRNKAPRSLIEADIWVGHVLSMDTEVPAQAIDEKVRYFELIARTFDVIIFDEADMVQSNLDSHGAAVMKVSGAADSVHRKIQAQIHDRFAGGENHRLLDRNIELYSRDLAEFGNHNYTLVSVVKNVDEQIRDRFANQLLTTARIIAELLDHLTRRSRRDQAERSEIQHGFTVARACTDFWDTAAYMAFYDRTGANPITWSKGDLCARTLEIERGKLDALRNELIGHFRRYLAENLNQRRDVIMEDISKTFLQVCFQHMKQPLGARDAIKLLVSITFMILGYQRIIPGTRQMVAEGLIRDPIIKATATPELRRVIPENILGSLSGVKYSLTPGRALRRGAQNVELSYVSFVGAPRLLMHRFHRLLEADGASPGPAVLMTSATSFLEASPAYHINVGPHYLLKARDGPENRPAVPEERSRETDKTRYVFKWIPDRTRGDQPLRYSGAGELALLNLQKMTEELVRGGVEKSEIFKAIRHFDVRSGIHRKAAIVVNSYDQSRILKRYLDDTHRDIGRRTKAVVRALERGEKAPDYITPSQVEAIGDDETCDILLFPLTAIGRGVNVVFTKGPRARDAAIGSIYFLTRPHPPEDDMQLLQSLAAQATQMFDERAFSDDDDLGTIAARLTEAKASTYRLAKRLLQEPLQASRLGAELFRPFSANQMVAILQTIGRGMRSGCPVAVHFVDAAWAPRSAAGQPDDAMTSMLVQMRVILESCLQHENPIIREIYNELYMAFLRPLREVERVIYSDDLRQTDDSLYQNDGFEGLDPALEI